MQEGCIPGGKATWLSENPDGKLRHDLFKLISKNEAFYIPFSVPILQHFRDLQVKHMLCNKSYRRLHLVKPFSLNIIS
jgi:hypothetical protein